MCSSACRGVNHSTAADSNEGVRNTPGRIAVEDQSGTAFAEQPTTHQGHSDRGGAGPRATSKARRASRGLSATGTRGDDYG